MALPSSGVLSFYDIQTEMGGSNPISLTEYYGVSGLPSSGTIKVSDFHGKSKPSGSWERTTVGTTSWTVPAGVYSVQLCMIGGGGAAYNNNGDGVAQGGFAGSIVSQTLAVTPGETIQIVVGAGGVGQSAPGQNSSFGAVVANGAPRALVNPGGYEGWGGARTTCYGTAYDGAPCYGSWYGGQAGFGNGGGGRGCISNGVKGGGGGCSVTSQAIGSGGTGVVKISWG